MTSTVFSPGTVVASTWLNDVNTVVYKQLPISVTSFGVVGTGDETVQVQNAVNALTSVNSVLDLAGLNINITTINLPNALAITIQRGNVTVTSGAGFSKVTSTSPQSGGTFAKYDVTFDNVQFTKTTSGGSCIYINLAWQDATGGVITTPSCNFQLTNGAVGVRLALSFFSSIEGRFNMDSTSTGLLFDSSQVVVGDTHPSCPFAVKVGANFSGGIGFDQVYQSASAWNSFEGCSFVPGTMFYNSKFFAKKYNLLKCTGVEWNSSHITLDSGFNTIISGGYADRNVVGDGPLMTFLTTNRTSTEHYIGGGIQFNAQGSVGDLLVFSDASTAASAQISNVVIDGCSFLGGLNDAANQINGIKFDHALLRNCNVTGAQTFQNLYSCLYFNKVINRSVINQFDARDISWYAFQVSVGYGVTQYNRFDPLYRIIPISLNCANYTSSLADETMTSNILTFPSFMRPPVAAMSGVANPFGAGFWDITATQVARDAVQVNLVKKVAATTGTRGGATGTLTLDASQYVAPL